MAEDTSLAPLASGVLSHEERALTVGQLEQALLRSWPACDACDWDHTGMLVGNPDDLVKGVAVALDPTLPAIDTAAACGANVLLTHHPVFVDAPEIFTPSAAQGHTSGAVIRHAIERGVSIISFHTALDVSHAGLRALPQKLLLNPVGVLDPLRHDPSKGFGCICTPTEEGGITLRDLSARCVSVTESIPRVWGNASVQLKSIVVCGGAASSLTDACLEAKVDCLVCGEIKYHAALDASLSGLSIIELGHDISEFPLCALLAREAASAGVPENCITMVQQGRNWYTPEAIRR